MSKTPTTSRTSKKATRVKDADEPKAAAKPATTPRAETKQAKLIAMLRQPDGATIDEIVKAFGWQAHTARGVIAGALKKKLGLDVTSEKVDGRRFYKISN